jgi:hypothetical protein
MRYGPALHESGLAWWLGSARLGAQASRLPERRQARVCFSRRGRSGRRDACAPTTTVKCTMTTFRASGYGPSLLEER